MAVTLELNDVVNIVYTLDPEKDLGHLSNACYLYTPPMTGMTTYDNIVTSSLLNQPYNLVMISDPPIDCWQRRDVITCDINCIPTGTKALQLTIQDGFPHTVNINAKKKWTEEVCEKVKSADTQSDMWHHFKKLTGYNDDEGVGVIPLLNENNTKKVKQTF